MSDTPQPQATILVNSVEEQLHIEKRIIETGKTRVEKKVHKQEETINLHVTHEDVVVERIPISQYVDVAPSIRYEGDTMIIPVLKEVMIIEKKLLLVEEVRVTKRVHTTEVQKTVMLRKEEINVEHITPEK